MSKVSAKGVDAAKKQIDEATAEKNSIPGTVFNVINKRGEFIFQHASGEIGLGIGKPAALDSIFWIASCTKMITGIACMQLVEQGKLALDDVDLVEKIAPELKDKKVLQTDGTLVPKNREITLRMLLDHTSGFSYSFFNKRLNDYYLPAGVNEFSGIREDVLNQPLLNQPGERFEYGVGIDWAGVLVERVTGLTLDDYFKKYIFSPLGIQEISFRPTAEMKKRLMYLHVRSPDGVLRLNEDGHLLRRALRDIDPKHDEHTFQSGGAGCFGKIPDYCQIIAALLNDGTHPKTGGQILRPETVNLMFHNSIPQFPEHGRIGIQTAKPVQSNDIPDLYAGLDPSPQGWGLTFQLHLHQVASTGREAGSAWWAGLPNCYWWCDRTRGIGGMIGSQILPFADAKVFGLWANVEKSISDNLEN